MHTLRDLAGVHVDQKPSSSRIVVVSIHQPTSDIFHLFTNIILMNAGRVIYHGSVEEVRAVFESMNKVCPPRYNPAEFYINTISDPRQRTEIVDFLASKKELANYDELDGNSDDFLTSSSSEISLGNEGNDGRLSWLQQCRVISHRSILNFCRYPNHYLIELFILFVSIKLSILISFG